MISYQEMRRQINSPTIKSTVVVCTLCLLFYAIYLHKSAIQYAQQCDGYRVAEGIFDQQIPPETHNAIAAQYSHTYNASGYVIPISSFEEAMNNLKVAVPKQKAEKLLEEYWQKRRDLFLKIMFFRHDLYGPYPNERGKYEREQTLNAYQLAVSEAEERVLSSVRITGVVDQELEQFLELKMENLQWLEEGYRKTDKKIEEWSSEYDIIAPYLHEVSNLELKESRVHYFIVDLLTGAARTTPLIYFIVNDLDHKDFIFHRGCIFYSGVSVASLPPSTKRNAMIWGDTGGRVLSGLLMLSIAVFLIHKDLRGLLRAIKKRLM
ncbi:hypothetical protein CL635_00855 [bacterium]|nr:hypothetical protein [bacterium]